MTEQQWMKSVNIERMLECLVTKSFPDAEPCNWRTGERKKRLFICACFSRIWNLLPTEYQAIFEMLEPDVEGLVSDETRQAKWSAAERISREHEQEHLLFFLQYDDIGQLCYIAARIAAAAVNDRSSIARQRKACQEQERREQTSLLRDIFGNPFRSVAVHPSWLTLSNGTVVKLAQAIYSAPAFDRLPILADALEEAGCANADILAHCRQPGEHVRGCWVVDLILGKK